MKELLEQVQLKEELQLPDIEVPTFILRFIKDLKEKGRAYGTYVRYSYYLDEFVKWLKKQKHMDINFEVWKGLSDEDYNEYYKTLITKHHYSIDSIKRVESVLMQMYLYIIKLGYNEVASPSLTLDQTKLLAAKFNQRDFVSEKDFKTLILVMRSKEGLTEHQLKGRDLLINRNVSIATLFYKYGLTMQELVSITMKDIRFVRFNQIEVRGKKGATRLIEVEQEDKLLILSYLNDIPKAVRPKFHTADPLFAAFDYQRLTYRWIYDNDDKINNGHPKALSRLAIQKMILQEVKRAGLDKKGISAQSMRNSAILRLLANNIPEQEILIYFGLKTAITLRRYKDYLDTN
ncbi:tyrosine-type recombinase/integrase [Viridibacillus arvi]|uniref:tyrosine-type recombinase/integrase n=1 Tax=Viridibacillus arvi TaxID=263475 RepID=UPI0034CF84DF